MSGKLHHALIKYVGHGFLSSLRFPFIAAYGAVTNNQTLLQLAYDQCRLYRDSLRLPEAGLWAHIWSDDRQHFDDKGLWATGTLLDYRLFLKANVTFQ